MFGAAVTHDELDGVFVLDFGGDGQCTQLQEWWLVSETPAD